jgi:hypothetical protein
VFQIQHGFMKKHVIASLFSMAVIFFAVPSVAQLRKIPSEVTQALKDKYPGADNISWKDKLTAFAANFEMDNEKYEVRFNDKGEWKGTEKLISESDLPWQVKDGFDKSKYADWEARDFYVVELPDDIIQYKIHIVKNEILKKNLFYNNDGQLLKDNITLK